MGYLKMEDGVDWYVFYKLERGKGHERLENMSEDEIINYMLDKFDESEDPYAVDVETLEEYNTSGVPEGFKIRPIFEVEE